MPYKLSPHTLHLFSECPRCFWLEIKQNKRRPSGPFPSLPSGVDRLLKHYFDSFINTQQLPPELLKHHLHDCALFTDRELLAVWRNNLKGIQYTDPETSTLLRGAIDTLLVKNDKLIVMDYKTRGFPVKEDTAEHYHDQLNIYNFLLRKNGYATEEYAYLLFYIPERIDETGHFTFRTDLIKVIVDVNKAEQLFKNAIKFLEGDIPPTNPACEFCTWQTNQGL